MSSDYKLQLRFQFLASELKTKLASAIEQLQQSRHFDSRDADALLVAIDQFAESAAHVPGVIDEIKRRATFFAVECGPTSMFAECQSRCLNRKEICSSLRPDQLVNEFQWIASRLKHLRSLCGNVGSTSTLGDIAKQLELLSHVIPDARNWRKHTLSIKTDAEMTNGDGFLQLYRLAPVLGNDEPGLFLYRDSFVKHGADLEAYRRLLIRGSSSNDFPAATSSANVRASPTCSFEPKS